MHHEHNSPPKSSSPNRNNDPHFVKLRKKLANVSTNTGEYKCPKCEEREELLSLGDNDELKVNYIKALNYINSCHGIMNELLGPKGFLGGKRSSEVIMPELPNFLDIFGAMQKGLSSQSSSQSSRRSSKTLINPFVNDTGDITARLEHSNNDIAEEPDKEESENLEIKVKRSFIELVPDIKQLDEFKKIDDESLPKSWSNAETTDSDNSLEKSGKNFIEMNIIKAKEARIRTREQKLPISKSDRLEFCGSKARNNERYKESEDNQTVEKSKSDDGVKIETLMPEAPKEINLHSYEPNPERVQRRIKDDKGKNSDTKDDVFDRYAKELLESSEGSTQITPRKGSVSPQRKVKFSEQLVSISKDSQPKFDSSKDSITGSTHRVTSVNCRSARQSKSPSPKSSCANELNVLRANDNSSMNTQASHLPKCMHACTLKQIQQMAFTKRKLNVEKPLDKAGAFRFGCGESSDTDYIPSDSESEKAMANLKSVERSKTEEPVSHPLKLSQRNLHSVDGNVVVNMGLFNKNGQLPKEVIKILEDEKTNRAKDARNKPFRTMRTLHEEKTIDRSDFIKLKQVGSDSSSEYSDVDSELVMQDIVEEEIQKKNQQTIKAKLSTSRQKTS